MLQPAKVCGKCSSSGLTDRMVGCDMCDVWFHPGCVEVTETNLNPDKTWKCSHCANDEDREVVSQHTNKSVRSSVSSRARKELLLQQLEEQRALRLQQRAEEDEIRKKRAEEDEAFLQQKLDLILEDDNESRSSRLSSRASRKKVVDWLNHGQAGQTVATSSSHNRVIPQQSSVQHITSPIGALGQCNTNVVPLDGIPTSTSTPQAGKVVLGIQEVDVPPTSIPVGSITSLENFRQNIFQTGCQGSSDLVTVHRDKQSFPLYTLAQISQASNVIKGVIPKSSFAETKVTFSGKIPQSVPPKYHVAFGSESASAFVGQKFTVVPPESREEIAHSSVNVSTVASVVPTSAVSYTCASVPPPSAGFFHPEAIQRSPLPNVTATSAVQFGPQQFSASHLGALKQPAPSNAQLAARQVMPRELPNFSGDPQDWPLFSSSFYNSTAACGFTDVENLSRLQRCLKGHALDSVKSRLLMPESVPHVMETLRRLYGRPEELIHTLLRKLHSVPSRRTENLQSIIVFGMAVRNLVDHMFITQLTDHLRNPMLLHELVEKLPSQLKMQWSWYKRSQVDANLATFGEFMTELVNTASDVTLPSEAQVQQSRQNHAGKDNQKLYVHSETSGEVEATSSTGSFKSAPRPNEMKRSCHYCSSEKHEVVACPQFQAMDIDGRWKAVRSKGLCRTCLIPHRKWPCRSGKECGVEGCRLRHHAMLHSWTATNAATRQNTSSNGANVTQQNHHSTLNYCLFRYLPVTLKANGKQVYTYAFLDDGCQTTLMEAGLAEDLQIMGLAESLWLGWTSNISREEKGSQRVAVTISGAGLKSQFQLSNVRTVQKLQLQGQTFQYEALQKIYPHLRGLPLRSYFDAVPRLIIGIEHAQLLTTLKVREGRSNEPIAVKTRLGWCVYGKQAGDSVAVGRLHVHTEEQATGNRELHDLMRQYFAVEEAAIATPIESADDSRARRILEQTARRIQGGFEIGLLWKYDQPVFPDSYPLALRRLQSLEKRLDKDQKLKEAVVSLIKEYEEKRYAHRITQDELDSTDSKRVWYLPLGVVRNPKKPAKVRLIWDAAARVHGISLNDMLMKGPDMLTSLFAVLLRFRQRSVAVCGDIREMFHQVRIIPQDKQAQRFLFRASHDESPQIYVMDVATFGASCSPCLSQFIKNRNAREFESQFPKATEAIVNAHYVDDYLDSVDSIEEAVQLVTEVKHVHSLGGFEIRNFSSNSRDVLQRLGETECTQKKSLDLDGSTHVERVLGMVWKPKEDVFCFDVMLKDDLKMFLAQELTPTKRQVLRLVMSLFDPYGFIAHYIVHGKILMQYIWRSGTEWDHEIPRELQEMWRRWIEILGQLQGVEIPRCFFGKHSNGKPSSIQLHMFVDASELACACAAYLRIVQAGVVRCVLVAAKTKVAPLKPLSIPRLELQACVIGCRLMETIQSTLSLTIERRFFWSDSATALAWIKSNSRRYHPFVAFRVGEILNTSNVDEWCHVPSKQNVADDATKWGGGPDFNPNCRWYVGEAFLYLSMFEWPKQTEQQWHTSEELRSVFHLHRELPSALIDVSRFSNWNRLVRSTAYVYRAVQKFRGRKVTTGLTSDELMQAENLLWRQTQFHAYPDEYSVLKHNQQNLSKSPKQLEKCSALYRESPFMDEAGVIRMNSRIVIAPVSFETKYPVILPKDHELTRLLVDDYHRRFLHMYNDTVFNEIRQRFRIPQLRPLIKRVVKNCQLCQIKKVVPQAPMMAALPAVRLTPHIRAFSYTGVDYFGPLMVKQGRCLVKRWVALFTCLTIRAVHLEIVHSLSTQSCVMAIRRFVNRRGFPTAFYSDNGTCFKGASNLLAEQIQKMHQDCASTFTNARTTWHFNPPSAPHMGGCWERMVRSVKAALAAIAEYPRHPSEEVLETVVLDAEAIVNSRPLTYIPLEDADQEALTPNHFLLYGTRGIVQPRTAFIPERSTLRYSWKLAQYLSDQFWKRWVREYLPTISRRTKWFQPTKPLEPGDLVFIVDENKRNGWVRGRVMEVFQGKDGQVRSAKVQTREGVLIRPAVKLAVLDVQIKQKQGDGGSREACSSELHGRGNEKKPQGSHT